MMQQFAKKQKRSIHKWQPVLAKGGGQKLRFQYCVNPNYSHKFLNLRAIQGHSGSTNNRALQDKRIVTRRFCRIHLSRQRRKRSEINGELWLIPGGVSLKTGRHAVFFTVVIPISNQDDFGETPCNLSKARIAPYKRNLETTSGYSILVRFEARSRKRTAISPNNIKRSHSLRHTACRAH